MILAFSLGESVVNHLARRCLLLVSTPKQHGGPRGSYNFALPRKQNEVAISLSVYFASFQEMYTYLMAIPELWQALFFPL